MPSDLVTSLSAKLRNLSPLPVEYSIYRVPERLQHANEKAYNPQLVSIGPFHHGIDGLQAMQEDKMLYLKSFLDRTKDSVEMLVNIVKGNEEKIRGCYSEAFPRLGSDAFVEIFVVDSAFVVELLCRNYCRGEIDEKDRIFRKPLKLAGIRHDMMLLENQIPFFLLEEIFLTSKLNIPLCDDRTALVKIVYKFFHAKAYLGREGIVLQKTRDAEIDHFVDFFRLCHVPTKPPNQRVIQTLNLPSATELFQSGVKFKGSDGGLLDMKFSQGTFAIPHLRIRKSTESFLLNMIAFEQCHLHDYFVNDYVFIIARLIVNARDVEVLVQSGVFESKLPDNQEVVTSINNLVRGSVLRRKHFNFKDLCDGLNNHHGNPWNTWVATLRRDYFSSPLTIFAVGVATALFVLTLVQTICSCGLQFKKEE